MTRLELQQKLMEFPPDTHIEVCVRTGPEEAADYDIADITPVINANWATISLGEVICTHALYRTAYCSAAAELGPDTCIRPRTRPDLQMGQPAGGHGRARALSQPIDRRGSHGRALGPPARDATWPMHQSPRDADRQAGCGR